MIAVVQRVSNARVEVAGEIVGEIEAGLLVLASVHADDTPADIDWTAAKLVGLRIFRNADKHFDLDVQQVGGGLLLVSNFTVAAATRQGRRPSLDAAAGPQLGRELFDAFVQAVRGTGVQTETGRFGADMKITLTNDGPATFLIDSREARPAP